MKNKSNPQKFIYKNDKILNHHEALISIDERGFLFGDGLFETCRFINKKIINFEAHLARIKIGLLNLKLDFDIQNIEIKCYNLIEKNNLQDGIIRISISRGIGSKGYLPTNETPNLLIIQTKELPNPPKNKNLIICDINPPPFKFKSANALPYVLAKIFAEENNYFDAIMLDEKGYICETSSANIFWIKNEIIYTSSNDCDMVRGTIREALLELKDLKIKCGKFKISALKNADEVFITNSTLLILPIDKIAFRNKKVNKETKYKKILVKKVIKLLKIRLGLI
jgi:branched-subunit amino acid aminotransferase/4-amino-4-deoxychorismate lyase